MSQSAFPSPLAMPYKWYHYLTPAEVLPHLRSSFNRAEWLAIEPPFKMPPDVERLKTVLDEVSDRDNLTEKQRSQLVREIIANFCSALTTGRQTDRVTILPIGDTGQGKSATINKLIGQRLLRVGREESTTRGIETVLVSAVRNGLNVSLAFVDTPGFRDTTVALRGENAIKFYSFCEASFTSKHHSSTLHALEKLLREINLGNLYASLSPTLREDVYPNAILLTTRWDRVQNDAQNPPDQFTTPIGHAIWSLNTSRLFDAERPNVIVIITRSLTDPSDYLEGDRGSPEFNTQWLTEANKIKEKIWAIQEKVFPGVTPWPVVFVENGGNPKRFGNYDKLPNGEQSHQNLFDELARLFDFQDKHGGRDFLGLQALATAISDASPYARGSVSREWYECNLRNGGSDAITALAYVGESSTPVSTDSLGTVCSTDDEATIYSPVPGTSSPLSSPSSSSFSHPDLDRRQNAERVDVMLSNHHDKFWNQLVGGLVIGGIVIAVAAVSCSIQ